MSKHTDENIEEMEPREEEQSVDIETDAAEAGEASAEEAAEDIDELEVLTAGIRKLEDENLQLKNDYLRKQADFDNFRKRMFREKEDAIKFANTNILNDIILIIDDFERAIKSSTESRDFDTFHEGITLIEKQFVGMLERKYGLKRFESQGEEFDPQLHEAIGMEPSSEYDTQVVLEDYQKGYMLNDRVLRHAKVKVSMPQPAAAVEESEEKADEPN